MTPVAASSAAEDGAPLVRRQPLHLALLAVIAVGLLVLGGALAVAFGIGADEAPATPAADSVDAGFSRDMAVHHLQGVEMANVALDRSSDPEVRQLAFDISASQTNQTGRMQGWLALWGLPLTGEEHMAWMGDGHSHSTDDGAIMPGMATDEELAGLRSLTGTDFDVEFLRLMIRHHQGGADMAAHAVEHGDQAVVRDLARSIAEAQAAETSTMTSMLTARGGTPLPPP